jgi:hypothetical protein
MFYAAKWGACLPLGEGPARPDVSASSYMYLPNVNASYQSPQDFDNQPLGAYQDFESNCASVNSCTLAAGQPSQNWRTTYPMGGCQGQATSKFNPYEAIGECMNYYNVSYIKTGCLDSHTPFSALYSDAACTQMIYSTGRRAVFAPLAIVTLTCQAEPSPWPTFGGPLSPFSPASPGSPESTSSSLKWSTLLLFASSIAFLTMLY